MDKCINGLSMSNEEHRNRNTEEQELNTKIE